jgi:AcrR family transcriptional regulator
MSAGRSSATGGRRRRRSPEVAEQEIIAAAEELLRERPFRELTVDEVMRRTDLSRPSFYVYFRDRHHLVLRVVERLTGESADMADIWYRAEGSGRDVIHEATTGIVAIFERHGAVMEALADAAADDREV